MRLRKLGINGIPKKDQLAQIKKINIWKWLFLGLVSLLVALGLVVQSRLATPREDVRQLQRTAKTSDVQVGTMTTTRDQLNDTIKYLLKKIPFIRLQGLCGQPTNLARRAVEPFGKVIPFVHLLSTIQVGKREYSLNGEGLFSGKLPNPPKDGLAALE